MITSAPSSSWMRIASSGVNTCREPSYTELNSTPSSRMSARALEAEDLEASGVGEDRPVPLHEPVEAAVRGDDLGARAEVQVIGVAEDDLRAELPQLARLDGLDRRLGADGHEAGRLDHPVGRHETSGASGSVARLDREREPLRRHRRRARRPALLALARASIPSLRRVFTAPASRRRNCRSGSALPRRGGRRRGSPPRRRTPSRAPAGSCAADGSWSRARRPCGTGSPGG